MARSPQQPGERITAFFSGHVQGVGFRFTALDIAEAFEGISGYVRNLPDGRVELCAEGAGPAVEAFLGAIQSRMGGHITAVEVFRGAATGEFAGFSIAH